MTQLLTEAEAAAMLHVCTRSLRRLRQSGAIRYVAVTPRTICYRTEDVQAFIDQRTTICHDHTPTRTMRPNRARGNAQVISFTARRKQAGGR